MAKGCEVRWYEREFEAAMRAVEDEVLDKAAATCAGQTAINIRNNDQIDTGFMLNSTYMVSAKNDTYSGVPRTGKNREAAPVADRKEHESICAVAANYAIFQEFTQSFLYAALQATARQFGGIVSTAGREVFG